MTDDSPYKWKVTLSKFDGYEDNRLKRQATVTGTVRERKNKEPRLIATRTPLKVAERRESHCSLDAKPSSRFDPEALLPHKILEK